MSAENGMNYDVSDTPPFRENLVYALQQFLAICAATILVPLIVDPTGQYLSMASALIGAGFGTIVYLVITQFKSPVFLGSSFAFIGPLITALSCGFFGVIFGALIAALVYLFLAGIIKAFGTRWIDRYLPARVIGPTVALIGLCLAESTITNYVMTNTWGGAGPYSWPGIIIGLLTFFVIVFVSCRVNRSIKLYPFVIGILFGYIVALIVTGIGMAMGSDSLILVDFAPFEQLYDLNNWIPKLTFLGALGPDQPPIEMGTLINILVIYMVTAFVVFAEHLADHKNISSIIKKDLIKDPGLHRTLTGDGLGSFVGSIFGGVPNTTYGESIGCVAFSKNASTRTILLAAVLCIIIAFVYPLVVMVQTIPWAVIGATCIALYGFIAVSGLRMIGGLDLIDPKNLYVVAAILICGVGGLQFNFGDVVQIGAIPAALIVGVITNLIVGRDKEEPEAEEA